ncbi:autotransporter outer membrane beta-barrel domain-containing protein [Pseudomonas aeruginosa]|uniref:Autotransporter beta-domain protein n=3 Tax=Gammaproteobacteria TaxID=1236 RepID=A6V301_PSEP7|nr:MULTISPECIES: S8 family serine peptidase [Pseudomonas aeruginosa group]ABR83283.2 autotransporter beta-domain protein [Pseudomonas aeruginosa PA7]KSC83134.1 autotransporter outer membrane beta-barrel domain-containing protein [Pseudomonas aeruginosa]KSD16502.1 autotransporter outer membrane beta-barrel domain-containing protein [Pseudomonas aeruginosa]KSG46218.1 autotransporter outer membrane beta-barrel domain-containing protein [Pseudomonas aeruginosa]MCW8359086.1 S8 family serine peptida
MSRTTHWKDFRKRGLRTLVPLGVSLSLSPCALAEMRPSGWEQDFIGVAEARGLGLTGKGVDVGVIDGGFLPGHPAFAGQAISALASRVVIDGEEVLADPMQPLFERDEQSGEIRVASHGANVSGIIAARAETIGDFNYRGGVAPQVRLFQAQSDPSEDIDDEGADTGEEPGAEASPSSLLQPGSEDLFHGALTTLYRSAPRLRVINNSYNDDPIGNDAEAVDAAYAAIDPAAPHPYLGALADGVHEGRLLVFAAGNESIAQPGLLATLPRFMPELEKGFLSVVALGPDRDLTDYSNQCGVTQEWCLAAPGDMYVATASGSSAEGLTYLYDDESGTSYAAPLVSASAALLAERFPYMDMAQVRMTLLSTATDLGEPGVDARFGWGLLDLARAVRGPGQLFGDQRVTLDAARGGWNARDVWSNAISAGGVLAKSGSGALLLAGDNRFAGVAVEEGELALGGRNRFSAASEVRGGRLVVDGILEGPRLSVGRAGELSGGGTVAAPTRIDGVLVADRAPGFTRSLELSPSSTTRVALEGQPPIRLDGAGAFARLGGRLQLTTADTAVGAEQKLLAVAPGATYVGGFAALQQAPGLAEKGLRHDLRFTADGISLALAPLVLPGQAGLPGNAGRTAAALNALRDQPIALRAGAYNSWLQASLSRGDLGGLQRGAGGQVYADSLAYLSRQPARVDRAMFGELSRAQSGQAPRLWFQGLAAGQRNQGRAGVAGSRERSDGLALGMVQAFGERTRGGATLAQTKGRVGSAGGKVELDITQLAVGLLHAFDSLEQGGYVSAMLGAGYLDAASKRRLPGFATAKGDSEGWLYHASVKSGYRWRKDDWWVEPRVGLLATRTEWKGFREKHSELALDVDRAARGASFGTLEMSVARSLRLGDWSVEPELDLGYERALRAPASHGDARLQGIALKQVSASRARDLFRAGLALHARRGPLLGSLELQGAKGERVASSAVNLRLSYDF